MPRTTMDTTVCARMDFQMYRELERIARRENLWVSEVVREAVEEYLERHTS